MAVKIAISNHKGGVAKSTSALMIAEGLALFANRRVLVVDLDPQGSVSRMLIGSAGLDIAADQGRCLTDLWRSYTLSRPLDVQHFLQSRVSDLKELRDWRGGSIDLIASHPLGLREIGQVEEQLRRHNPSQRLDLTLARLMGASIASLDRNYDAILFDCSAGPVSGTLAALRMADLIIAPTQLEKNALAALTDFVRFVLDEDLGIYMSLQSRVYVLITMFVRSNQVQQLLLDQIRKGWIEVNAIAGFVSHRSAIQRAVAHSGADTYRSAHEKYNNAMPEFEALALAVDDIVAKFQTTPQPARINFRA